MKVTLHSQHTPSLLLSNEVRSTPWPDKIWDTYDQSSFFGGYNRTNRQTNIRINRQTDMTKLVVALRNSPNEPENEQPLLQSVWYEVVFRLGVCRATSGALMNLRSVRWKSFWVRLHNCVRQVLSRLRKLRKATMSFVTSAFLSVSMKLLCSNWTEFHKIWYLNIFL